MTSHDDDFWDNHFDGSALAAKNAAKSPPPAMKTVDVLLGALDSLSVDCKNVSYETAQPEKDTAMTNAPTQKTYTSLDAAYDHFNRELFGGQLPACLITMQRHRGAYGYFSSDRFASLDNPEEVTDEIALNPATFKKRTPTQILSTLAHEQAHVWQHHFGKPSRSGYHNRQWAAKMIEIGLIPTDTGQPGGKQVGQKVTHMIAEGGPFETACRALLAKTGPTLYHDRVGEGAAATRKKKAASKTKFSCPACEQNAWAKPDALLICGVCHEEMEAEEPEESG